MPKYTRALLEVPVAQSYARTCAHKAGLSLKVEDGIKVPYTTEKTLVVPALPSHASEDDVAAFRYGVIHETLHHSEGSKFDYLATLKKDSPLRECYGMVEDFRIEKVGTREYEGDKRTINTYNEKCRGDITRTVLSKKGTIEAQPEAHRLLQLLAMDWEARGHSGFEAQAQLDLKRLTDGLDRTVVGKKIDDSINQTELIRQYSQVQTPDDAVRVAEALFKYLFDEDPETQKKPQKGGKKKGEGESEGEGEGEGEAEGKPGDKGDKGDPVKVEAWQRHKGLLGDANRSGHAGYEFGSGVNYKGVADHRDYGAYIAYGPERSRITAAKELEGAEASNSFRREYASYSTLQGSHATGMANTLRRVLQVQSQAFYINNQRKGKLSTKNAYRLLVPQVGDGEWNTRVFRKKVESDVLDAAVCVLVDCSGSMRGPKYVHAIDSAILLNAALSQRLHIPVEVLGFTDPTHMAYLVAKEFDERVSDDHIRNAFGVFSTKMANNADGEAILWAYHRIRNRKEKRKLLIVLSDGAPCGGAGGSIIEYTKAVCKQIEDEKRVHLVGIGIEDSNVRDFYKRTVIIDDSNQLSERLLEVCRRDLFNLK